MHLALPIVAAVLLWWSSTGLVLWLINRPAGWRTMIGRVATILGIAATAGVFLLRDETGLAGAYLGFVLGLIAWGWHETLFLLGFVSGPRRTICPPGLSGNGRFKASVEAILHHEVGIALHAVLLGLISIGAENMVATFTFMLLWAMRLSAKLLVFFGAPNIPEHFLPQRIRYLGSYFKKTNNPAAALCALSFTLAIALGIIAVAQAAPAGGFEQTACILLATLAGLAVFEHLALVIRLPDQSLWSWALRAPGEATDTKSRSGSTSP
jgi:putative photosynthetic complex assembly protein 2